MDITPTKPDRHTIEMTNDIIARHWAKKLGKSRQEIEAAIEKVGNNAETVCKELGCIEKIRDEDF